MLDQLFTAENFREIYDEVNRKGKDLGRLYFPQLKKHREDISEKNADIRALKALRSTLSAEEYYKRLNAANTELEALKANKDEALVARICSIASEANRSDFTVTLERAVSFRGKSAYTLDKNAASFFVSKQVQKNLKRIYKVQPANRYEQISRLIPFLGAKFPFQLVRTDLASLFESLPADRIMRKLNDDRLLAESSRKVIEGVIGQYKRLSGSSQGVPRGVGFSSYLAELYLRAIDEHIKGIDGVCLYLRYVDDIIVIASFSPYTPDVSLRIEVEKVLTNHHLTMNTDKTSEHELSHRVRQDFSFLGYRFFDEGGGWQVGPSASRIARYEACVESCFTAYDKEQSENSRRAYRSLVARVRFLTGNTRLVNSKSHALTGIYYNNSQANHFGFLDALDAFLKRRIRAVPNKKLRARLSMYSFRKGFDERQFRHFSAQELSRIVEIWDHVA